MKTTLFGAALVCALLASCVSSNVMKQHNSYKQTTVDLASGILLVRYSFRFEVFNGTRREYLSLIGCHCAQPEDTTLLVLPQFDIRTKEIVAYALLAQVDNGSWHRVSFFPPQHNLTELPFQTVVRESDVIVSVQEKAGERKKVFRWKMKRPEGMRWVLQEI